MVDIISVETMRNSDKNTIENGTSGKELMLRAGTFIFENVKWKSPVAIVCGSGNNAGDGYVLALLLTKANIKCQIILLQDKFSEDGRYYFDECVKNSIEVLNFDDSIIFSSYGTIVDCIFGTGFKSTPKDVYLYAINKINESGSYIVSVDINSGLNGDTGMANSCVISDKTISIGTYKPGHFLNMAKDVIKSKINGDIGIPVVGDKYSLVDKDFVKEAFPKRSNYSNKSSYGYIALIGGSENYSGAIRLAAMANAAMRSGAGVAMVCVPDTISNIVSSSILESTVFPLSSTNGHIKFNKEEMDKLLKKVKSISYGMGIGISDETEITLKYIIENYEGTLIIDADGLNALSRIGLSVLKNKKCKIILTPHNMEFSRLTGLKINEILDNPISLAQNFAKENNVTLLLKGPSTIITNGDKTYICDKGCAGMATAGSGDVLSGIIAAVCGYCKEPVLSASASAYINGLAGEYAQNDTNEYSMLASDTINKITTVISEIIA